MSMLREHLSKVIERLKSFEEGMEKTKKGFDAMPFMIKSYAERDFEVGSGKSANEWLEEAQRYRNLLENLLAVLDNNREPTREKVSEALEETRAFISSLKKLHKYLEDIPSKLASVPSYLMPNLDESVAEARRAAEDTVRFIEELEKLEVMLQNL